MANTKSQKKRIITNEKSRIKNSQVKSSIRTAGKKLNAALNQKDINKEEIQKLYVNFSKTIDTAAQKNIVHKNAAARKKSRFAKKVNKAIA